ncbi:hypothetical protein DPMN_165942 [Dreissena polymorpha]|uniref:Uncharacterized protein n=1 Tax=Dreissena polymorpha TaxID=45954 RepID=A0A9D4EYK0_DREPO|nr:hypothetical protein DPMN_165942 [Dreissena polymorpha]
MSCRLQSRLKATNGGSENTSFILSDVCSVCRCLRMIRPMLGSVRENVITSGILVLCSKYRKTMEQLWKSKLRTYRPYGINVQE